MTKLVHLKYAMEKMKPLDTKMKHQVERLLRIVNNASSNGEDDDSRGAHLKPNIAAMRFGTGNDDDNDIHGKPTSGRASRHQADDYGDGSGDEMQAGSVRGHGDGEDGGVYRAPRMVAMHFDDDERARDKEARAIKNKKRKLQYSEVMESLREEFGKAPEVKRLLSRCFSCF
jgi:U3 small nucleolar ribonucleoprotein protein LCP5